MATDAKKVIVKKGVINGTETGAAVIGFLQLVNSTEMIDMFVKHGLLEEQDKELGYSTCVYDLCNNGVAYVLAKMIEQLSTGILSELYVIEGKYDNSPHTWIALSDTENIFIDPTLAQFEKDVPDIAVIDANMNDKYSYDLEDVSSAAYWLESITGQKIDVHPDLKDLAEMEGSDLAEVKGSDTADLPLPNGKVDAIALADEALDEWKKDKKFKYQVGTGEYSYDKALTGVGVFLLLLEEVEMEVQENAMVYEPIEYQELATKLDAAIKHTSNIAEAEDLLADL